MCAFHILVKIHVRKPIKPTTILHVECYPNNICTCSVPFNPDSVDIWIVTYMHIRT